MNGIAKFHHGRRRQLVRGRRKQTNIREEGKKKPNKQIRDDNKHDRVAMKFFCIRSKYKKVNIKTTRAFTHADILYN